MKVVLMAGVDVSMRGNFGSRPVDVVAEMSWVKRTKDAASVAMFQQAGDAILSWLMAQDDGGMSRCRELWTRLIVW